jgi:hypothetical protein
MRAVRLIFEYDGDQVDLVSERLVNMVVTNLDTARTRDPGVYVDARDANGKTLARVPAYAAFAGSAEIFPENPSEPIVRMDVAKPKGAFTVVVPMPTEASQVTVVRIAPIHPEKQPYSAAEAVDVATFPLQFKP